VTGPARALIGEPDRDRFIAFLREHYAAGRLSMDELERRVEVVLSAGYADEAAAALAGLPGVPGAGGASGKSGGPAGLRAGWLRRRGHGEASQPGVGWVPTAERFRDPSSGVIMRVWVDPVDQSRHYVPDTEAS
jgi:Domain of unknown function (DUF1707)